MLDKKLKEKILNEYNKVFKDFKFTRAYMSKEKINSNQVSDIMGTKMFKDLESKLGYLVFINPNTMANYCHECNYWFFCDDESILRNDNAIWMPSSNVDLEQIL